MKTLFAYLSMLVIVAIFVADVFCIKYLGLWSILICLLSIIVIVLFVGIGIALFEEVEEYE